MMRPRAPTFGLAEVQGCSGPRREMISIGEWSATTVTSFRFPTPKLIGGAARCEVGVYGNTSS
jgi:hypothetical protein